MAVDIYAGGRKQRYQVWMRDKSDTLTFLTTVRPDLVNADAEKILLARKTDNKTLKEFAFQYAHAPLYVDRSEAIDAARANQTDSTAQHILVKALNDSYYGLRIKTMQALDMSNKGIKVAAIPVLIRLAGHDKSNLARAEAITTLGELKIAGNVDVFKHAVANSTSYAVQGAALNAIQLIDPKQAFVLAKNHEKGSKGKLRDAIITIYCQSGGDAEWPYVYYNFADPSSPLQYSFTGKFASLTGTVANPAFAQQGIEAVADLVIGLKKYDKLPRFIEILNQVKADRLKLNDTASSAFADQAISRMKAHQAVFSK
jgi:aminopeptidase N